MTREYGLSSITGKILQITLQIGMDFAVYICSKLYYTFKKRGLNEKQKTCK